MIEGARTTTNCFSSSLCEGVTSRDAINSTGFMSNRPRASPLKTGHASSATGAQHFCAERPILNVTSQQGTIHVQLSSARGSVDSYYRLRFDGRTARGSRVQAAALLQLQQSPDIRSLALGRRVRYAALGMPPPGQVKWAGFVHTRHNLCQLEPLLSRVVSPLSLSLSHSVGTRLKVSRFRLTGFGSHSRQYNITVFPVTHRPIEGLPRGKTSGIRPHAAQTLPT